jgi:predicted metal-dependent HD superfamily phosphohydrolase
MVSPERLEALQQSWVRLLGRYNVAPREAYPPFDLLVAAYTAPDRHYHNLEHLAEMFRVAARLALFCDDPHAVQLAVWFHDAVYDPRSKDNEERSAELVGTLLGPVGVSGGTVERVARMVRMTAHLASDQPPGDRDTAALIDADLAILGASEDRYRRYAADIRREYAWVPDPDYAAGRRAVLERFLARPRIFWHEIIYQEGESRARTNLRAELDTLSGV